MDDNERKGQVWMRRGFGLVLLLFTLFVACADEPMRPLADAGVAPPLARDAGAESGADASLDLHFLLIAAILETERTLLARCPCLTDMGQYETTTACEQAVSLGRGWVDCANALDLSGLDNEAVRTNLRCNIEQLAQRSECLTGSACREEAIARCMTDGVSCPMLPLDVFSRVATECMIAFSR